MNEDRVQARLRELREAMTDMNAPESVEHAAMAAFRSENSLRRKPLRLPIWRWAAAACLVAAALVGILQLSEPERPEVAADLPKPPAPVAPAVIPEPRRPAVVARSRPVPAKRPQRRVMQPPEEDETATAFVALPYAPPLAPAEDQHLVRVRLPRGAMRQFGMVVREDRVQEPVQADFLLGQDGVARAVRLVNNAR
jgi:hypothetical protein